MPLVCCDWVSNIDFIYFFIMKDRIGLDKKILTRHINIMTLEVEDFVQPIFHLGFHLGSDVNKMCAHGPNICGKITNSL